MDTSYIGKIGVIEGVSSHTPFCCKLTIDGVKGSWSNAWLFSMIKKVSDNYCKEKDFFGKPYSVANKECGYGLCKYCKFK
jgi:hypothetical protein